jgi:ADP-ribose pyrophosphatase YjhB (NUDIX family)
MNRKRATAVIIKDNEVLLIHRVRKGLEYHVFPGGGVEEGETYEDALVREVQEELTLDVIEYELLSVLTDLEIPPQPDIASSYMDTNVYLVSSYNGTPEIGGPEKEKMSDDNQYHLAWIKTTDLKVLPDIYPHGVLNSLLDYLKS